MKKTKTAGAVGLPFPLLKFLLLMKVSFAVMLITCMQVSATTYSQGDLSLHYKKTEVSKPNWASVIGMAVTIDPRIVAIMIRSR